MQSNWTVELLSVLVLFPLSIVVALFPPSKLTSVPLRPEGALPLTPMAVVSEQ